MKYLKILFVFIVVLQGCSRMSSSEYSYERIDLTNGSHIMAIHNANCPCHKNMFKPTAEKSSYLKMKYDVFCSVCWEPEEIKQMNHYSKANIVGAIDWDYVNSYQEYEFALTYSKLIDSTYRIKDIEYALRGEQLIAYDPQALPDKHRYIIWD